MGILGNVNRSGQAEGCESYSFGPGPSMRFSTKV